MQLVVARVGRAHGLRGEVTVQVRTDDPMRRLAPGTVLDTDPPSAGPLTVAGTRDHNGTVLLTLQGVGDRSAAEALRGVLLIVEVDQAAEAEPDAWFDQELVGLAVHTVAGAAVGTVRAVEHLPAQDLLVVAAPDGKERLVPLVRAIVTEVDVAGGRVVLDPPPGLIDDVVDGGTDAD